MRELDLVDEDQMTWGQVIEFRNDEDARRKYRRLVRWLDAQLLKQEPIEILATLEERLDGYHWAIRKHGLNTKIGVLQALLDPKFLGGAAATVGAATLVAGAPWAVLAGAGISIGRVLVSIGTSYVAGMDARTSNNQEVAYLYEISRQRDHAQEYPSQWGGKSVAGL